MTSENNSHMPNAVTWLFLSWFLGSEATNQEPVALTKEPRHQLGNPNCRGRHGQTSPNRMKPGPSFQP